MCETIYVFASNNKDKID